ncbi:MAG: zinc dependent phospholipase C family protein [Clostridiales bacterium]|nr:zinc dependent phospholipase C family protein [Clostridiales bacterium]
MKIKSHIKVANVLLTEMTSNSHQVIHKNLFKLGSIVPDVLPHLRFMHHHFIKNEKKLIKYTTRLSNTTSTYQLSYNLGKITHYISDSFLYVHNIEFKNNLILHRRYENKFSWFIKEAFYIDQFYFGESAIKIDCIIDLLTNHLSTYLNRINHKVNPMDNFMNDLLYIVHVNTEVINAFIRQFQYNLVLSQ